MSDLFTPAQKFPHLKPPAEPDVVLPAGHKPTHTCAACGAPASFGFGVAVLKDKPGTWYCAPHKGLGG